MYERWEAIGTGQRGQPFEIEPGIDVFAHQWFSDARGPVQIGKSGAGPFLNVAVYVINVAGQTILFGAYEHDVGVYTFYRRLWPTAGY